MFDRHYSNSFFGLFLIGAIFFSSVLLIYNVSSVGAEENWWNKNWSYRKLITISHSKVSENVTGFPVLIDTTDPDLISKTKADGADIVFTDYSGTKLAHEIESYDNQTGHLVCWVNSNLSMIADTELYIYYGNSAASNQESPAAVWDSDYSMVQHLAESEAPPVSDWHKCEDNPILNGSKNGFASVFFDNDTGVYHLFCSWGSILHFTSPNGQTVWTADPLNPVLSGNNEGVPMVWKEGATWYMLYRYGGPDKIGLANSTDASNWTRYEGNPVINVGSFCDPWGVIKVGSTYYLWYNDGWGTGGRCAGLATSTDLKNWTPDPNNPIFTGGRFCVYPFKYDGYYYMIVPRYTASPYGEMELYRDVNPTFYASSREYLGVIVKPGPGGAWDDHRFDTPCVLTDTIYRDSYQASNNELWMYYAATGSLTGSESDFWTGMCIEQNITDAITRLGAADFSHFDSTANNNDGRAGGLLNMNVTGKIDGADHFNAGTQDYISCGDSDSLDVMTALTIETWVKLDFLPAGGTGIIAKWSNWTAGAGGSYILFQGSAGRVGWGVITETSTAYIYDTPILQLGGWYHLVGTYDGSQIKLYVNGTQTGTPVAITGRIASTNDLCYIGRYTTPYFNGTIDEVRISNMSRNSSWIQTEYGNQQDPSTFYTVGSEETETRTQISVNPSLIEKTSSDVGTTFAVNITVQNVTDLFGFEFNLTWNNNLIKLVDVDYETSLDSLWGSGQWLMVRNETALAWYRLVAVSTSSSFTGTAEQAIAELTFQVEAFYNWNVETGLHFAVVKLSNSQANPINTDASDGVYRMGAQKPLICMASSKMVCRKYAEPFNVSINIEKAVDVKDFTFEIYYNTTMIAYVPGSVIWGDLGTGTIAVNDTAGSITGSVSSLTPIDGEHWLLNLMFQDVFRRVWRNETLVSGWINDQSGRIWIHSANLSYLDHSDLHYEEGGADQIIVTELECVFSPIQGDTNNDGLVDVFDLRIIGYYYGIDSLNPGWTEASQYDLNGDNIIDIFDLATAAFNYGYVYGG